MTSDAVSPPRGNDVTLIASVRAGDPHAYAELFDRHRQSVERLARALRRDGSADELVGSVFADGLREILEGDADRIAVRPWLLSLTKTSDDPSGGKTAFEALDPEHQAVLWQLAVDDEEPERVATTLGVSTSALARRLEQAREALRTEYLRQQREASAPLHARTHLDDVTMHADECATCLGLWWAAEELSTAKSLAASVLGDDVAERYLRTQAHRKTRRVRRPRWIPTAVATVAAGLLLSASLGALAVAQWGPGSVPEAWRTINAKPSTPVASDPSGSAEPDDDASGEPDPRDRSSDPDDDAQPEPDRPSAGEPSASPEPKPDDRSPHGSPGKMPVSFAFADPVSTPDGNRTTFQINFSLGGESVKGSSPRTATMRFMFEQSVRLTGSSGDLNCSGGGSVVTCTRSLTPGENTSPSITVVGDDAVSGQVQVSSSDLPDSPSSHSFSFRPVHKDRVPDPVPTPTPSEPGGEEREPVR